MKAQNNITLYTQEELQGQSMAWITDQYNIVGKLIGLKAVKKFRDKATAISRTLDAQETYREDLAEAAKQAAKTSKKTSKNDSQSSLRSNKLGLSEDSIIGFKTGIEPKAGTIEDSLVSCIREGYDADMEEFTLTVKEIVDIVSKSHKRPRSLEPVDQQYVIHNIKWFIRKGHLTVEK
jgi:hypothetical protein